MINTDDDALYGSGTPLIRIRYIISMSAGFSTEADMNTDLSHHQYGGVISSVWIPVCSTEKALY